MSTAAVKRIRVFVIESPSALDLLDNRAESQTLEAVCKLLGHDFACSLVRSQTEFETAVRHVTSINEEHVPKAERGLPLCLHIAAHGDKTGLAFGPDDMNWR